jgi:hypothetical protein
MDGSGTADGINAPETMKLSIRSVPAVATVPLPIEVVFASTTRKYTDDWFARLVIALKSYENVAALLVVPAEKPLTRTVFVAPLIVKLEPSKL